MRSPFFDATSEPGPSVACAIRAGAIALRALDSLSACLVALGGDALAARDAAGVCQWRGRVGDP